MDNVAAIKYVQLNQLITHFRFRPVAAVNRGAAKEAARNRVGPGRKKQLPNVKQARSAHALWTKLPPSNTSN